MTHAITIENLAYRAGRHFAIRNLHMRVPNGSVYGFLGPNGSGKTTTIRLLLGMLPPADGTISVLGHDVPHGAHHALARIGYVPERLHLYPMLTVEETMRYHASFYGRWDATEAERLRSLRRLSKACGHSTRADSLTSYSRCRKRRTARTASRSCACAASHRHTSRWSADSRSSACAASLPRSACRAAAFEPGSPPPATGLRAEATGTCHAHQPSTRHGSTASANPVAAA
jgi:ABC-type glutathione transport system ATPase component